MRSAVVPAMAGLVLALCAGAAGQGVALSSFLGGPGADGLAGVGIAPDGSIILAGTMPGAELKTAKPVGKTTGSGDGVLLRLSPAGDEVLSVTRLPGAVGDMDIDPAGNILITGGFGSMKLDPTAEKTIWQSDVGGPAARIAPVPDGGAVVLSGGTATVLGGDGASLASWKNGGYAEDVACHLVLKRVFVVGFHNKRGHVPGEAHGNPVQVAYVYAYDMSGSKVWTAYDWKGQEVADLALMADTRCYRVAIGDDGKLYIAGESAGGNTMWSRKSQNLQEKLDLAGRDRFQVATSTAANHITFVGRMDPATGRTEAGTMLLSRFTDGKGNTIRPRALAATPDGRVFVGGMSASSPPVSRGSFGATADGAGAFFIIFDKSFKRVYASKPCAGCATGIAVGARSTVIVGQGKDIYRAVSPIQEGPGGGDDGWVVVLADDVGSLKRSAKAPEGTTQPAPKDMMGTKDTKPPLVLPW